MNFDEELREKTERIDAVIREYLPREEGFQRTVEEAMNYSVLAGGKRLRPLLMRESFALFGGEGPGLSPFMAAMEMLHTYSLVHDDLPCMDNDEYRRGRKTTHAVYGEGMAVLAGDGLLNYAFETAVRAFGEAENEGETQRVITALRIFGRKAGIYGMIGGQTADVEAEKEKLAVSESLLLFIHEHKTAALIQSAMMIGAVLAGASEEEAAAMEECGRSIGIAFQIKDDILDVAGDPEKLGKSTGSDEKNEKTTYVTLNGMDASEREVERLSGQALGILAGFPRRNEFLEKLVERLISRDR